MNTPHRGCQGFLWRQAVHPFIYLFIILIGFFLLGGKVYPATAAGTAALGEADALPAGLARPDEVTPLPTDCSGLALPGEDPPAACIYGYVYLDETPVLSATLTLHSGQGTLSLLTQMGSASESPYYAAALSGTPLSAQAGDLLTASVDFISQTNLSYFETRSGAQQVDLHLSSTCGHTQVGGVLSTDTHWTAACAPYLVTESLYVLDGVELSIDPGVTVLVSADQVIEVEGVLTAPGTSNAMIAFTSAEVAPAAGDWGSLLLTDLGAHLPADTLHYTLLEYSGGLSATDNGALRVNNAAPSLSHLTVRHSASDGVHFYNNAAGSIQASHIYQNAGWGLYFRSEALASTVSQVNLHHNQGGGAYYYSSAGTASLTDSTIANNQGIGVYVSQIAPGLAFNLERSTIQGNRKLSEGAGVYLGSLLACTVRDNAILDNVSSGNGAGIRFNYCTIEHNRIVGNQAALNGGGLYMAASSTDTLVRYNVIANNVAGRAGGGIWHAAYNNLNRALLNNAVLWNTSDTDGAGLNILGSITVQDNTILYNTSDENNTGGVYVTNFPLFNRNNLYGNLPYGVSNGNDERTADVNAESNYWGTADPAQIPLLIWDEVDDRNLGTVDFNPYLAAYNLDAPLSPVSGLAGSVGVTSVALSWNANPEADVAGYQIYYDMDGPGYPYSHVVDVGKVTSYLLTGLPAGTYHISVTAYDTLADGQRDQTEGHESWFGAGQVFTVGTPLVADFSASPTSGEAPLSVVFTNLSTGVFSACLWDFGDGATSTSCGSPSHTYAAAGTYTVSLTVTGLDSSNTKTRTAYITAVNPPPPVADFSGTPTSGDAALSVAFTNLSSGYYTACAWDFGDGATSTQCVNPSHTYTTVGTFSVSLTVTGLGGSDTKTLTDYITTSLPPAPEAHFTAAPVEGSAPLKVTFTNTSTGYYTGCAWEFGDGGTSTACSSIYTYQVEGVYAVKLTVTGLGGTSTLLITDYITVTEWVDKYPFKVAVPLVMR